MIIHENMIVCTVCDYIFAVEMHMVEHSRRNWLSDAPEGGGEVIFFLELERGIT